MHKRNQIYIFFSIAVGSISASCQTHHDMVPASVFSDDEHFPTASSPVPFRGSLSVDPVFDLGSTLEPRVTVSVVLGPVQHDVNNAALENTGFVLMRAESTFDRFCHVGLEGNATCKHNFSFVFFSQETTEGSVKAAS